MRRKITVFATAASAVAVAAIGGISQLPGSAAEVPGATPKADTATVAPEAGLDRGMLKAMRRDLKLDDSQVAERLRVDSVAGAAEQRLRANLGRKFAGAWIPKGGTTLTVAVTDEAAAAQARAAGVEARIVRRSQRQLDDTKAALDRTARKADKNIHSWYVDPATNTVVVTASEKSAAAARKFAEASGVDADAVRVVKADEAIRPLYGLRGGDQIHINNAALCSIAFPVVGGYLTAGHCGGVGSPVNGFNGVSQGTFRGSRFPGADHAFVQTNANWTPQPWVNNYSGGNVTVAGSTEAAIGAAVCRSGRTSKWRCGVITAKNITVNYAQGAVTGMTNTTACAEPGDSGGAFISGNQAQGITSGGGGNCSNGGTSVYQPINPALAAYNVKLVTTSSGGSGGTPSTPTGTVSLKSNLNGRCIDIPNSNAVDRARLQMWDCNNTGAQKWTLGADGTVRALGKCMDANQAGTANGTVVQLFTCNGTAAQRFTLTATGDLVNVNANKCVDVLNANPGLGAQLHLWTCFGPAHQKWTRA